MLLSTCKLGTSIQNAAMACTQHVSAGQSIQKRCYAASGICTLGPHFHFYRLSAFGVYHPEHVLSDKIAAMT